MKLKTLKVLDDFQIGGSTLERPEHFIVDAESSRRWMNAMHAYENSFLPMEDQEKAERLLPTSAFEYFSSNGNKLKVGTEVSVDLEVERVEQQKYDSLSGSEWVDCDEYACLEKPIETAHLYQYRTVLRIVDKKQ